MLQVVDLVNKIKEKKDENLKRSFLFNDLINDRCHQICAAETPSFSYGDEATLPSFEVNSPEGERA